MSAEHLGFTIFFTHHFLDLKDQIPVRSLRQNMLEELLIGQFPYITTFKEQRQN